MAEKKYIGVTIGPIFDTMNLTSSPVALWAASYIFSLLSKTICEKLVESGVLEENIITPYYKKDEQLLNKKDGVGLFHDRIIFLADNFKIEDFNKVKDDAIEDVAKAFNISDVDYLKKYFMVAAAELYVDESSENAILKSGPILDSLELSKPFVKTELLNPIISLFSGKESGEGNNDALRKIPVIDEIKSFQLKKDKYTFKSLEDIVNQGKGYKRYNYYAMVRSDGDNMSKIISSLSEKTDNKNAKAYIERVRDFSKDCLTYCSKVAEKVKEYNGVTIYSGGDDLLAILPCTSKNLQTPFHFIKEANEIFNECFDKYNKSTSLSFGVTMAYHKFPLYEALEDSAGLLFGTAKNDKNCTAIRLQKHSGQAENLIISNEALQRFNGLADKVISGTDSQVLLSALHKIHEFKNMFNMAKDKETIYNLFKNVFDADLHNDNNFLHETLPNFFMELQTEGGIKVLKAEKEGEKEAVKEEKKEEKDDYAIIMCFILRILKFFVEKGGEEA